MIKELSDQTKKNGQSQIKSPPLEDYSVVSLLENYTFKRMPNNPVYTKRNLIYHSGMKKTY